MRYATVLLCALVVPFAACTQSTEFDWVQIGGACFAMGEDRVYPEEQPIREACVASFEIARTEVTNEQFAAFVDDTGYLTRAERGWRADEAGGPGIDVPPGSAVFSPPEGVAPGNLNWWRFVEGAHWRAPLGESDAPSQPNAPVVHITKEDAEAFAEWAGGRLPEEAEWELAARGGLEGQLYAWDDAETEALTTKANTWQGIFPIANTEDDGFAGISPVGSYPANGFGLFDMIGNVWELTSTPYTPSHGDRDRELAGANGLDRSQPGIPVGTIKGGSYLCASSYCFRFRPAARQAQDLAFGTSHIGFRLVRDSK